MQAKIEKIGDQFGLMLPGDLLQACGFGTEATVTVQDKALVVTPAPKKIRAGWAEAAQQMRERGDDLSPEFLEWERMKDDWDDRDWNWPGFNGDEKV